MLLNQTTLDAAIGSVLIGTSHRDTLTGGAADDKLLGVGDYDTLYGNGGNDTLDGGSGSDYLDGGSGNDYLDGGTDQDNLQGGDGNDVLYGGAGNFPDWLNGGAGNDQYVFGRGDGHDRVTMDEVRGATEVNSLRLREGVLPSDLVLALDNASLIVKIAGTDDKVTASNFLYQNDPANSHNALQRIVFANGTTWNLAEIKTRLYADIGALEGSDASDVLSGSAGNDYLDAKGGNDTLSGGTGDDTVYGGAGNDVIDGGAGDDTLYGGAGDDVIQGGAGHDRLYGGPGNDTYLFGYGDGEDYIVLSADDASTGNLDTLQFKEGIQASDLHLWIEHNALVIQFAGSNDMVAIDNFVGDREQDYAGMAFKQIRMHDGTTISRAQIEAIVYTGTAQNDNLTAYLGDQVLTGLAGNDTLDGGAGNDTMDGGAGNDVIAGGIGNDIYVFGKGDGQDTLLASSVADVQGKVDTLQLKAGIDGADLQLSAQGTSLIIRIDGTSDQITVNGFVKPNNTADTTMPLQQITFADGLSWDLARINAELAADSAPAQATASLAGIDAFATDIALVGMAAPALA